MPTVRRDPCPDPGHPAARVLPQRRPPLSKIGVEEVFTWAEGAQFPLSDEPERLDWTGLNSAIRFVHRSGQLLIAWNRGKQNQGFSICARCGATEPGLLAPGQAHRVPYLTQAKPDCQAPDCTAAAKPFCSRTDSIRYLPPIRSPTLTLVLSGIGLVLLA